MFVFNELRAGLRGLPDAADINPKTAVEWYKLFFMSLFPIDYRFGYGMFFFFNVDLQGRILLPLPRPLLERVLTSATELLFKNNPPNVGRDFQNFTNSYPRKWNAFKLCYKPSTIAHQKYSLTSYYIERTVWCDTYVKVQDLLVHDRTPPPPQLGMKAEMCCTNRVEAIYVVQTSLLLNVSFTVWASTAFESFFYAWWLCFGVTFIFEKPDTPIIQPNLKWRLWLDLICMHRMLIRINNMES